ncbi:unnamed protein product [Mycena citricolor]|uniref:Uncharacterized protein n=1 Tax=Mycena citricolor TaxID=2018698 RepID=A0AAD2JX06_9AGAR|nr:unnamed protein product [Mycena citricolor]
MFPYYLDTEICLSLLYKTLSRPADSRVVILEPTARGFNIDSGSSRSLRENAHSDLRRNLREEIFIAVHDPTTVSFDNESLFDLVPDHLSRHNNLSPHSPSSPTLAWLFNAPLTPSTPSTPLLPATPVPPIMANPIPMPARGDRNAPVFDSSRPHELRRYFSDLEFLLTRSAVTDAAEKKGHAVRFLSVDDQEIWEGLASFSDAGKSYEDFKAEVLGLYAGNDADRRFSLDDLDRLVGQTSRVGIHTKEDLTLFYRQFLHITTFLISKGRLSVSEQSRFFLRAMHPTSLAAAVRQRLQIKKPDVHPEDPYDLTDLYDAAKFVLAGSSSSFPSLPLPSPKAEVMVKPDPGISALVSSVSDLVRIIAAQQSTQPAAPVTTAPAPRRPRPDGCGYCSELDHFIGQCPHVVTDTRAGKCRRNTDGKVVLPSGAFVPGSIQGRNLRERISKWHEANPGQTAAAQMMLEVTHQNMFSSLFSGPEIAQTFTLTDEERMEVLKAEMYQLQTRAQAKRAMETRNQPDAPDRTIPAPTRNSPPPVHAPVPAPVPPTSAPLPSTHPFAAARDGAYAPPKQRNLGVPAAKALPPRSAAPIYNPKDAATVFDSVLDTPITQTLRQVLSTAPEVRAQMREATSYRRAPAKTGDVAPQFFKAASVAVAEETEAWPYEDEDALDQMLHQQRDLDAHLASISEQFPAAYANASRPPPQDAWVVPDEFA